MSYIGTEPTIGNFQVCDAISVVNGQASYTMQVGGVNATPQSANHMLVSLNGILQKPNSSFTISSSTITFASNLVTGDVIDFIQILGDVLDLGVPSDNTVSLAKLTATGTKDATTFLRGDNTFASAGGDNTPYFYGELASNQTLTRGTTTKITGMTSNEIDSDTAFDGTTFTVPSNKAGKYYIEMTLYGNYADVGTDGELTRVMLYKNGSQVKFNTYYDQATDQREFGITVNAILNLSASDTIEMYGFLRDFNDGNAYVQANHTSILGYKLIG